MAIKGRAKVTSGVSGLLLHKALLGRPGQKAAPFLGRQQLEAGKQRCPAPRLRSPPSCAVLPSRAPKKCESHFFPRCFAPCLTLHMSHTSFGHRYFHAPVSEPGNYGGPWGWTRDKEVAGQRSQGYHSSWGTHRVACDTCTTRPRTVSVYMAPAQILRPPGNGVSW